MTDHHLNTLNRSGDGGHIADIPDLNACSAFGYASEQEPAEVEDTNEVPLQASREPGRAHVTR